MAEDPFVQYQYTDATTNNLMAGEGVGIYVGHTQHLLGPIKAQIRGGIQHGFISAQSDFLHDSFTYFPVYANLMFDVSPEISFVAGAFYAINPFYKVTVGENSGTYKLRSDVGYNAALRWTATPTSVESDNTLYMEVRFEYTEAELTTYSDTLGNSDNLTGLLDSVPITNLGLAIGFKF